MWVKRQTAIPYQLLSCEEKKMSRCFLLTNSPIPWPDVPLNPHWKFHISQIQSGPQIWLSTHKLAELTPNFRVRKFEFMQSLLERLLVNHRDNIAPFCSGPTPASHFLQKLGEGYFLHTLISDKQPKRPPAFISFISFDVASLVSTWLCAFWITSSQRFPSLSHPIPIL